MNNLMFAVTVGAVTVASLGVAAWHYQSPVSAVPVVIVYHDSAQRTGQSSPSSGSFWTLAIRSDGTSMRANNAPDTAGHIQGVKSLQLQDRYLVLDPFTTSISTYKPYRPIVTGALNCSGKSAEPMLGHPVEYVGESKPLQAPRTGTTALRERLTEKWLAPDLNCLRLREHVIMAETDGTEIQFFREAVSIKPGEPPAEYFEIPSNYVERGPTEVDSEVEKKFPGNHVISNPKILDKLQGVYETDKPPK
jgi:hypothetical protein